MGEQELQKQALEDNLGDKVFKEELNEEALKICLEDPEFKAYFAYKLKEKGNKGKEALESLKNGLSPDEKTSYTICTIYNATGSDLKLYKSNDFNGKEVTHFPQTLANGQWAAVLHEGVEGSSAAVIYEGKNKDGEDCAWLHAWENGHGTTRVLTEIKHPDHYHVDNWKAIENSIEHSGRGPSSDMGCYCEASSMREKIGGNTYIYSGVMTLKWCFPENAY
ncbi:hypothetical protein FEM48_Zijuj03G0000800 [Ziziphus jujuba var. spinosa]|uniref:23 kDa jasmonate-induced protein-like n=1 Tax=Ziziphus jujuba var. spinosa TaxID=714518 RepID=A0A978VM13_ZIZJJ|nr:uncharacterized protein LOC125421428 [Ziziphus jujuba var. spinosa]KAH7536588.1 hypothetical protein FEM48_Zijuj03G0000800 [Ziziphus jujuba var. spinosa]